MSSSETSTTAAKDPAFAATLADERPSAAGDTPLEVSATAATHRGTPGTQGTQGTQEAEVGREGERLDDRYVLTRRLGRGGMGEVWEGRHAALDQRVAIKLLVGVAPTGSMARERFLREARASASLRHPGIVYVQDFGTRGPDLPYLVMELLEGESLAALIEREGPLPWRRVVALLDEVAAALGFAHAGGVVHRDLKPSNIFLARQADGGVQVKIIDFGIAKIYGDAAGDLSTQTGVIIGTPAYMSPEQIHDAPVDARSDLYSLGCVAYEMLTACAPFNGSPTALLVKHVSEHPQPPRVRAPTASIPEDVEAIVLRLLRKNPSHRFASCEELRGALARVATGAPPVEVPSEPLTPLPGTRSGERPSLAPLAAGALAPTAPAPTALAPAPPVASRRRPLAAIAIAVALVTASAIAWLSARTAPSPPTKPTQTRKKVSRSGAGEAKTPAPAPSARATASEAVAPSEPEATESAPPLASTSTPGDDADASPEQRDDDSHPPTPSDEPPTPTEAPAKDVDPS
ncbi:MAG: protein kinase [Myxococcales bacterium]|nr:protein kinase [Myxococcales bacterium]